ncbi:MAG TPA: FAD-dependent oxidoreductase [Streptosporangiaceae bacterium]|nr:FAD-dependent oxidoreductase [Streptosporangiaceae bacterium]
MGRLVHAELTGHGVEVLTSTAVTRTGRAPAGSTGRLRVDAKVTDGRSVERSVDLVLVVVGVRPDTELAAAAPQTEGPSVMHPLRQPASIPSGTSGSLPWPGGESLIRIAGREALRACPSRNDTQRGLRPG